MTNREENFAPQRSADGQLGDAAETTVVAPNLDGQTTGFEPVSVAPRPGRLRVARPRDPLVLKAEADEYEAQQAADEMAAVRRQIAEMEERAEAARKAAEESRAEAERARLEAEAAVEAERTMIQPVGFVADDGYDRDRALGKVAVTEPAAPVVAAPAKRITDKFLGSLGLFLLRVLLGAMVGLWGYQTLIYRNRVEAGLGRVNLPDNLHTPLAIAASVGLFILAVMLIIGWGTRIAAGILFVAGIIFLAFFRFGPFNPILENQWGFYGDFELLVTLVAFLFVTLGGGGWAADHAVRTGRAKRRAEAL